MTEEMKALLAELDETVNEMRGDTSHRDREYWAERIALLVHEHRFKRPAMTTVNTIRYSAAGREQLSRVAMMADSDENWILSANDRAALAAVLSDRQRLVRAINMLRGDVARLLEQYSAE